MPAGQPKPNVSILRPPYPVCSNAMWLVMIEATEPDMETSMFRCDVCTAKRKTDWFIEAD
jgi:hypothetical protein